MTTKDKACNISFPGFIDDVRKTRTPATEVTVTRAPKSGTVAVVAGKGLVYTPGPGFKGQDKFCTRNTSAKVKGKSLRGCITVTVR
nr:Ig-like domain-containing protein [Rhizobium sp. ACO-34A]